MTNASRPEPDLLALLGHELRTPLNAIIGYADALRSQSFGPLNPPYDQQAEIIHRGALHLLALVDDLAVLALPDGGPWTTRVERFAIGTVARTMVDLMAPGSAAPIELEVAPDVGEVISDRRALAQILLNLIDNARKHADAGGLIHVGVARQGMDLRLNVVNSVPARPPEAAPYSGSGLGLKLVRALCDRLGGDLAIDGEPGGGFTARVTIPAFPEI